VFRTLTTVGVRDGEADVALVAAARNEQPARRAAAAYALSRAGSSQRPAVERLLADHDAQVRFQAAAGLVRKRDKSGIPGLIGLLGEEWRETVWQAEDLLSRLAPGRTPAVSLGGGDDASRKLCRAAWEKWWRLHAGTVDFAGLDIED